ncbi:MAG: hypothetical protein ONB44_08045 [candidate division KSB1 bacterium]|nr:hypothetical protein [candidate division KSB1 bacterium]
MNIANLPALDENKPIPAKLNMLQATVSSQPDSFKVSWTVKVISNRSPVSSSLMTDNDH